MGYNRRADGCSNTQSALTNRTRQEFRMAIYSIRPCGFCGKDFQPATSRNKHCSIECRFKSIYLKTKPNENGCREWPLSRQPFGYGQMGIGRGIPVSAHRLAWTFLRGPIPDGMFVLHKCDNPPCTNPEHLFLGRWRRRCRGRGSTSWPGGMA